MDRVKLELFTLGSQKVKVGTRDLVSGILSSHLLLISFNPVITTRCFFLIFAAVHTLHDTAKAMWYALSLVSR